MTCAMYVSCTGIMITVPIRENWFATDRLPIGLSRFSASFMRHVIPSSGWCCLMSTMLTMSVRCVIITPLVSAIEPLLAARSSQSIRWDWQST